MGTHGCKSTCRPACGLFPPANIPRLPAGYRILRAAAGYQRSGADGLVRNLGTSRLFARGRVQRVAHSRHHAGDLRISARESHRRTAVSWASIRTRSPSRRLRSALEVLAANGVDVMIAPRWRIHADAGGFARDSELQPRAEDGLGGRNRDHAVAQSARGRRIQIQSAAWRPGRQRTTSFIQDQRQRVPEERAGRRQAHPVRDERCNASTTHQHDFIAEYTSDLAACDRSGCNSRRPDLGIDPLGGAGVHYWRAHRRTVSPRI